MPMTCFFKAKAVTSCQYSLFYVSCSPYTSFVLFPLPECFTTEQSTIKASLFVKYSDGTGAPNENIVQNHLNMHC